MGIEKLRRRLSVPGVVGQTRWSGITNIVSGSSSVVVSASQVKSGAAILTGLGRVTVASLRAVNVSVNSVVDNTSFCIVGDRATTDTLEVCYTVIEV